MSTQTVQQQSTEYPYFTEEHELIRQTVSRFCKEEIAPYAAEWDEEGIFPRELFPKAGALGMFGIRIDPQWPTNPARCRPTWDQCGCQTCRARRPW